MLTPQQQDEFQRLGILRVPGAVPSRDAEAMCDSVWHMLHRNYQIERADPKTWAGQRIMGTHDLPKSTAFEQIASPTVCEILDDLLGPANWQRPDRWASLLVSFPDSREPWEVPHQSWHLDAPVVRSLLGLYAVRLFTCLAPLQHSGGATLAVAGSARLAEDLGRNGGVEKIRSAEVRKALIQRHRWIRGLCSHDGKTDRIHGFMNSTSKVGDIELRVVEMVGEPGDVILMHPLTLHAASPNCSEVPRMVLSSVVNQRGVDWSVLYTDNAAAHP